MNMDAEHATLALTARLHARIAVAAFGTGKQNWVKRSTNFNRGMRGRSKMHGVRA